MGVVGFAVFCVLVVSGFKCRLSLPVTSRRFGRCAVLFLFSCCCGWCLYTTSSWGLRVWLGSCFGLSVWLLVGCASCHKLRRVSWLLTRWLLDQCAVYPSVNPPDAHDTTAPKEPSNLQIPNHGRRKAWNIKAVQIIRDGLNYFKINPQVL